MKKTIIIVITCALFFPACNSSKTMGNFIPGKFDKEGHRGCRGLMPENTIPAMVAALGYGVTTLEMDVCISKDKKVFLSHEPFFNHEITTLPNGTYIEEASEKSYNMFHMNYDSIVKYDVGLKPHPRFVKQQKIAAVKPLLSDVFYEIKKQMMTMKRPNPFFNIETKTLPETDNLYHPAPAEFVDIMMDVIIKANMQEQVIIQSFDFRTLKYLHQKYPSVKTAMLIELTDNRSFRKQLDDLKFSPTIYSPAFELVTANLVKECHNRNIKLVPWTVNDPGKIAELKRLGVDGLISDYPDLLND